MTVPPRSAGDSDPPAGSLCRALPAYCTTPPGTAVVFGFGVAEDGQLVSIGGLCHFSAVRHATGQIGYEGLLLSV
jgi:hypothetical protein